MPDVPGMAVPSHIYWILREPGPLLGMAQPTSSTPWTALYDLGVRHVACLTNDAPMYDPSPLSVLSAVELQDLYGGIDPARPRDEEERVRLAVSAIVGALRRGEGVVVHCAGGTGRTGTVIGAALVSLGVSPADAIAHLQDANRRRGRSWPESPWQEDLLRRLGALSI